MKTSTKSLFFVMSIAAGAIAGISPVARAATLEVGPNKTYHRVEAAVKAANPGDVIAVYPGEYQQVAVYVTTPHLTFRAMNDDAHRVVLNGHGYDYSGRGSIPRAIFQFNRGADDCSLEGFELTGAHNKSHNGAGVRINQANRLTVRDCEIDRNDMGVMSNSDGTQATAVGELIERCNIHHNGDKTDPGYNHNLYVGGTSVTLRYCWVHDSTTGHNVKSRAHDIRIEYCLIEHAANRECDFVDAEDTARPDSNAVLIGNIIVKDPHCPGNHGVIHFGAEKGHHDGTLYLVHNTIITPFGGSVVELDSAKGHAVLTGNLIYHPGGGATLFVAHRGADISTVRVMHNWISAAYEKSFSASGAVVSDNTFASGQPPFVDPGHHDYHLRGNFGGADAAEATMMIPPPFGSDQPSSVLDLLKHEYHQPAGGAARPHQDSPTFGAYAAGSQ